MSLPPKDATGSSLSFHLVQLDRGSTARTGERASNGQLCAGNVCPRTHAAWRDCSVAHAQLLQPLMHITFREIGHPGNTGSAISHSNPTQNPSASKAPAITRADSKRRNKQLPSQQISPQRRQDQHQHVSCRDPVPLLPVQEPGLQGGQHHMPQAAAAPKESHPRSIRPLRACWRTRNRLVLRLGVRTAESRSRPRCAKMPEARRGGCLGD